jgi:glycosyltransferase involved in cell wall biosynthesis
MRKLRHVPLNYENANKKELDFLLNDWLPLHSHDPKIWDKTQAESILKKAIERLRTCGGCRQHAIDYTTQNEPSFATRHQYHQYLWRFHNAVNKRIGKPEIDWEEYKSKWLKWKQVDGNRIGIVAINYEEMGGTETFHQMLVPRMPNVIGFASQNELRGNVDLLVVPTGEGFEAIASLALQSETVVSWNIDWKGLPRPKRLICVHHGSLSDTQSMTLCLQGDVIVCVNRNVAKYLRKFTDKPVHCIEPAVDPERVKPRQAIETNCKKICLWSHRFARDKQPQLAIEIAKHLPDDWHMVLTGHRCETLQLNDRVTVLPPQHPGDWLSVADCFLSTSLFEGFGLSVAEAITAGIPVVSTPVGIAARPGLALTVPTDADAETWAVAILASQSMPLPRQDLFSVQQFLQQWEEVINTV